MALPKLESPTYTATVPSTKQKIEYRPFTVKEQKTLLIAKESEDQEAMVRATRDLITTCTFEKVDCGNLSLFDFEYLFLKIRAKSVGETADVKIKCSKCEEYTDVTLELEKVDVTGNINVDKKVMLNDEVGVIMRWPTFHTALKVVQSSDLSETEMSMNALADCIECIFDNEAVYPTEDVPKEELNEFIDSLSSSQFELLSSFFNEAPTVSLDVSFKCSNCNSKENTSVSGLSNFF